MEPATKKNCQRVLAAGLRVVSAMTGNPPLEPVYSCFVLGLNVCLLQSQHQSSELNKMVTVQKFYYSNLLVTVCVVKDNCVCADCKSYFIWKIIFAIGSNSIESIRNV